jgi:hypothetical protein
VLQYVLVKPTMAVLAAILEVFGLYSDGDFHANRGYLYITIVNNISITVPSIDGPTDRALVRWCSGRSSIGC